LSYVGAKCFYVKARLSAQIIPKVVRYGKTIRIIRLRRETRAQICRGNEARVYQNSPGSSRILPESCKGFSRYPPPPVSPTPSSALKSAPPRAGEKRFVGFRGACAPRNPTPLIGEHRVSKIQAAIRLICGIVRSEGGEPGIRRAGRAFLTGHILRYNLRQHRRVHGNYLVWTFLLPPDGARHGERGDGPV